MFNAHDTLKTCVKSDESFSIERLVIFNFALFVKVISIYDEKTNTEILKIKKTAIFCSLIV